MIAAAAALVVASLVAVAPGALRARRQALALRFTLVEARHNTLVALTLLRHQCAETNALLSPWRRVLRWARHPLVIATLDWYRRRRRARR